MLHLAKAFIFTTMQPRLDTEQASAWKTFNRQKLGLFVLHSIVCYTNIDKVETFHILEPRH